jgi:hypothetical protein
MERKGQALRSASLSQQDLTPFSFRRLVSYTARYGQNTATLKYTSVTAFSEAPV